MSGNKTMKNMSGIIIKYKLNYTLISDSKFLPLNLKKSLNLWQNTRQLVTLEKLLHPLTYPLQHSNT